MSDLAFIPALLAIGSDASQLQAAQHTAAQKLLAFDGENYPSDGCAITLSCLLQDAGIAVPDTFLAFDLAGLLLKKRGWVKVALGEQMTGDVGTTCGDAPHHGTDHIYLVLKAVSADEMVIADNQDAKPHFRFVSGHGKSPTRYFLRAT